MKTKSYWNERNLIAFLFEGKRQKTINELQGRLSQFEQFFSDVPIGDLENLLISHRIKINRVGGTLDAIRPEPLQTKPPRNQKFNRTKQKAKELEYQDNDVDAPTLFG